MEKGEKRKQLKKKRTTFPYVAKKRHLPEQVIMNQLLVYRYEHR